MSAASSPEAGHLLLTSKDRPLPSVITICVTVAVLAAIIVAFLRMERGDGSGYIIATVAVGLLLPISFLVLGAHLHLLITWARWRRRGVPAMRISPAGLEYSAAFDGTFPLWISWSSIEKCEYRPDHSGHFFWCVDVPSEFAVAAVPPSSWSTPVGPGRARRVAQQRARTVTARGEHMDVDMLTHLLAFGTPVAINLHRVQNVPLPEVDRSLREWTHGRFTIDPDADDQPAAG